MKKTNGSVVEHDFARALALDRGGAGNDAVAREQVERARAGAHGVHLHLHRGVDEAAAAEIELVARALLRAAERNRRRERRRNGGALDAQLARRKALLAARRRRLARGAAVRQLAAQQLDLVVDVVAAAEVEERVEAQRRVVVGHHLVAHRAHVGVAEERRAVARHRRPVHQRQLVDGADKAPRHAHRRRAHLERGECCALVRLLGLGRVAERPRAHQHAPRVPLDGARRVLPLAHLGLERRRKARTAAAAQHQRHFARRAQLEPAVRPLGQIASQLFWFEPNSVEKGGLI